MMRTLWLLPLFFAACTTPDRIVILHFNDFHGQIRPHPIVQRPGVVRTMGGFQTVSGYLRAQRKAAPAGTSVWVTDGGDWFQGTPEGNEDRGWSVMACRNRLGFTAVTVGNHEYDFGEANLIRLIGRAEHPVLGANIRNGEGKIPAYVRPFHVENVGGLRIAIVGLIASDTKNVSTGPFGDAEFRDEVATLRELLPELRTEIDGLILLTHCGIQKDVELARTFPSIDLILGGHSHTVLPLGRRVGNTWIAQSAGRGASVSRVELELDHRSRRIRVRSVRLVSLPRSDAWRDAATESFLQKTFLHIGPKWDRPIGRITGAPDHRVRGAPLSTPGGNYVADLIRRIGGADVGLTNKGGLRSVLKPGPITRRRVFRFLPFDNSVFTVEMTGVQLRTVLAQGLRRGRQLLEIAGGRYGFRVVDGSRQLAWVEVAGRRLLDSKRYRVSTNSFLANGGDGITEFAKLDGKRASPLWLRDLMLRDLAAHDGLLTLVEDPRIRLVE